jgi:ring-1,2-phenylacetyl-CoA epoxidase subunit PaaD
MVTTRTAIDEQLIWDTLHEIPDPEIPAISIVDLGIVRRVECDGERVAVEIMPTFIACPAIGMICGDVEERLRRIAPRVEVRVTYEEQWTSDRITERGRENLRAAGYAPPVTPAPVIGDNIFPLALHPRVPCPFCDGARTRLENPFGPTLCRAIYYCPDCRQPFEHFKAV